MSRAFAAVRMVLAILVALLAGLLGLSLIFSDLGPGESWEGRLAQAALLYFFSGVFIGYLHPRAWLLAGIAAWGAVFLALASLLSLLGPGLTAIDLAQLLVLLLLPLGLALAGGYLGALIVKRGAVERLIERFTRQK